MAVTPDRLKEVGFKEKPLNVFRHNMWPAEVSINNGVLEIATDSGVEEESGKKIIDEISKSTRTYHVYQHDAMFVFQDDGKAIGAISSNNRYQLNESVKKYFAANEIVEGIIETHLIDQPIEKIKISLFLSGVPH